MNENMPLVALIKKDFRLLIPWFIAAAGLTAARGIWLGIGLAQEEAPVSMITIVSAGHSYLASANLFFTGLVNVPFKYQHTIPDHLLQIGLQASLILWATLNLSAFLIFLSSFYGWLKSYMGIPWSRAISGISTSTVIFLIGYLRTTAFWGALTKWGPELPFQDPIGVNGHFLHLGAMVFDLIIMGLFLFVSIQLNEKRAEV
ncbi:hypothetical protein [Salinithrix halophila]|uniref:Uncharacterized protein n=1 Tax=Salinithrix halophila TaxID=1485204 RepID=A0ABV8JJH6_9BACL